MPGRLDTYRRCRLTSDFAIACAFRFVIPVLIPTELRSLANGSTTVGDIQTRVQRWVCENVEFSIALSEGSDAAIAERLVRSQGLPGRGLPLFNPT